MHMFIHNFLGERRILFGDGMDEPCMLRVYFWCCTVLLHEIGADSRDHILGKL